MLFECSCQFLDDLVVLVRERERSVDGLCRLDAGRQIGPRDDEQFFGHVFLLVVSSSVP